MSSLVEAAAVGAAPEAAAVESDSGDRAAQEARDPASARAATAARWRRARVTSMFMGIILNAGGGRVKPAG